MPHVPHHLHRHGGPTATGTDRSAPAAEVGTHFTEPPSQARKRDLLKAKMSRGPHKWHVRKPHHAPTKLVVKNHFVAMVGEFVGTTLFLLIAFGGTNIANVPSTSVTGATTAGQDGSTAAAVNTSSLLYIALSFGFSLAVNAWIFFRISGGLFNPAVSLGMVLVGALTPLRGALLTFAQILGGICGAAIIQALTPGTLNIRTQLGGGINTAQGLFYEAFLTCALMLAILLLAAEKSKATFLAPVGIGLALFIAEMAGVYYTGGSLNPARTFGPDVVLHTFDHYHWIYWLGPALGATFAAGFYRFIKYLEYETVLGPEGAADDDDSDDEEAPQPTKGRKGAPDLTSAGGAGAPGMFAEATEGGTMLGENGGGGGGGGAISGKRSKNDHGGGAISGERSKNDHGGGAITTGGSSNDTGGGAITQEKPKKKKSSADVAGGSRRGSAIPGLAALQESWSGRGSRTGTPVQFANIGPGLGDLLTHGDPANAYDLSANNDEYYDARMDRIEALLQQLLAGQSPSGAQATATRSRDSDITLEGQSSMMSDKAGVTKGYSFPAKPASVAEPAPISIPNSNAAPTLAAARGERELADVEAGRNANLDALAGHISRERLNEQQQQPPKRQ